MNFLEWIRSQVTSCCNWPHSAACNTQYKQQISLFVNPRLGAPKGPFRTRSISRKAIRCRTKILINSYCNRVIYTFPGARRQELIDNPPPVLLSVYSKSPIWGKLHYDTLQVINEGYTTQVFLWHDERLKNRKVSISLRNQLHICQNVEHDSGCKSPLSISFEIRIPLFTLPGPNLTLLTPLGGGLVLRNTSASVDFSRWELEFSLVKNSEASRRVPQLSFRASNWRMQTGAANDSYKLLGTPWARDLWNWKRCSCNGMTRSRSECRQAVRINFSITQMDVNFGPALLSGNQCGEIYVDISLVDTCTQHVDCDGVTLVCLFLELSNASGVSCISCLYLLCLF